jgi:hypothetical protein
MTRAVRGALPCLPPDSRWVAFFASGGLYKVSVGGRTPFPACDAQFGATLFLNFFDELRRRTGKP